MCRVFSNVFLYFILTLCLTNCRGSWSLPNYKEFARTPKITNNLQHGLSIPHYLQGVLEIATDKETFADIGNSDSFVGVEDKCKYQILDWLIRLQPEHWETLLDGNDNWALEMLDAGGKIPEGILTGHVNSYGDFDQCVQIAAKLDKSLIPNVSLAKQFDGMYCTTYLSPTSIFEPSINQSFLNYGGRFSTKQTFSIPELIKIMIDRRMNFFSMLPSIGTCLPNTCTQSDVQNLLSNIVRNLLQNSTLVITPVTVDCVDRHKPPLTNAAIVVIAVLALFVILAFTSGILDYWQKHSRNTSAIFVSKPYQYLMAFSIYSNSEKLLNTDKREGDFGCLHGIRFFSTAWVVLGHTYYAFLQGPQWNRADMYALYKNWKEMPVLNATFSVDTFFAMSGMLTTYKILTNCDKTKGRPNILMFYVHRYLRLTPAYVIITAITATLIMYLGSGPVWWTIREIETRCQSDWWANMLYINNIYNTAFLCNSESWYLSDDMQFYILTPFIVYPLWKRETVGKALLLMYTVTFCIVPVLISRYQNAPVGPFSTRLDKLETWSETYIRPWSRISAYLVGIWLGWILYKTRDQRVILSKLTVMLLWILSTGIALAVLFGVWKWFDPDYNIPTVAGYIYVGLGRLSFAVAISWVIFACLKGYGGVINDFLSWRVFVPLGRLCFSVYLTSYHLQTIYHARLTTPIKWDTYTVVNLFFAHMVMSYLVGFFFSLFFESPFMALQKLVFPKPETETANARNNKIHKQEIYKHSA